MEGKIGVMGEVGVAKGEKGEKGTLLILNGVWAIWEIVCSPNCASIRNN